MLSSVQQSASLSVAGPPRKLTKREVGWRRFAQHYWNRPTFRGQVKFLTRNEKLIWVRER
jgi:hypothetical protein